MSSGDETGDATRRTHLANERTQLAWWRTGFTTIAVGVGVGRVVPELSGGTHWSYAAVGVGYIVYGLLFILTGTYRQRQVETAVMDARWAAQERSIVLGLTIIGVVLAVLTALLVVVDA
jgi:putative membrane protein